MDFRAAGTLCAALLVVSACAPAAPAGPTAVSAPKPTAATTAPVPSAPTAAAAARPATSPAAVIAASPAAAASPVAGAAPAGSNSTSAAAFDEQAVAAFYRGKTVRLVVGYSPGGGNDLVSRMLARHLSAYIPGSPPVVVENKPGAATMLAVNTVYNVEPKDGTVIVNFNQQLVLAQAIGADGVQFDATQFQWLGATSKDPLLCVVRTDRGIDDIQQVIGGKEAVLATTGPGSAPHDGPAVMNATLGTHFKLVSGYAGSAQQDLAMQNGEVDGKCGVLDTSTLDGLQRGFTRALVVMSDKVPDSPYLRGVPPAEPLARTDEDRALLRAVEAPNSILRAFVAPPGVPADRLAALRQAMARTYTDAEFLAEATKAQLSVDPSTGDQAEQVVRSVLGLPRPQLDRLKKILSAT